METEEQQHQAWGYWACRFAPPPQAVACAWKPFAGASAACPNTNFLKGVRWAPDGSCCLTASDDNRLRVFDLPQEAYQQLQAADPAQAAAEPDTAAAADGGSISWQQALEVHAGETVYDYCWFSGMSAADPASCCFASTSRGQPMHLWDACTGALRGSYRGYDEADEVTAAHSLAFSTDGSLLVGGYGKCLRVFHVSRPGRDCSRIQTHTKKQEGSIPGIISCLAFNPLEGDLFAAGSYSRCIGLFDVRTREQLLWLEGHTGGITQVCFSPDGNYLYSGARRDDSILCWDIRATGQVVCSMQRPTSSTNQRIGFSIESCGRHLATGGCDGCVRVFDLQNGQETACFSAASDTINGVSFSPSLPLLVTASGHRRYPLLPADGWEAEGGVSTAAAAAADADGAEQQHQPACKDEAAAGLLMSSYKKGGGCNSLRLWRMQADWLPITAPADQPNTEEPGGSNDM